MREDQWDEEAYQTMKLMSDAHAKDLRIGNDSREPLFQIVLFRMLDHDEPSGRDDRFPELVGARAGFVGWRVIKQNGFERNWLREQ